MRIEVKEYTKVIKKAVVLDNVSVNMESGKIYGFQGVNGSGKTMLMRAIAGLIFPTSGYVEIDGKRLGKQISFPPSIGILLESPSFISNYTAFENLKTIASIKKVITDDDIKLTIERVGLDPNDKRHYRKFSLGMKQKLGIAAAVMEKPDLVILDEPLNALDATTVEKVKAIIKSEKERGALVIVACHNKSDMDEICDEIIEIEEGKIKKNLS